MGAQAKFSVLKSIPSTNSTNYRSNPSIKVVTTQFNIRISATKSTSRSTKITSKLTSHDGLGPFWTVTEIAEAVDGRIVQWGSPGTISADTRTLEPNQWFFPIKGVNFDAHDFISLELSCEGCVGVIGNRVCENWDKGFVLIEGDTVLSLMAMATYARNRFHGPVVGVTGSVGKTTTTSMISLALGSYGIGVHQTPGSWNTQIGVALSLIGTPKNVGFAVLEMGMSRKGEILELARMARPTVRVILNVGDSHMQNFAGIEDVATAKGELLVEGKPGEVCVLNADDPVVMSLPVPKGMKKVLFGRSMGCDIRLVLVESVDGGLGVRVGLEKNKEMVEFVIPAPGHHLALNACAAAAVASLLGVSLTEFGKSLSSFNPIHMRSELEVARNGIKIINDAYNANPVSTKAAIELLRSINCNGKRVIILGDMLELGKTEIKTHEMILNQCCDADIDLIGLVGKSFLTAVENMKLAKDRDIVCAHEAGILAVEMVKKLNSNDVVLVKGSRAMQMEKVVSAIKAMHVNMSCE